MRYNEIISEEIYDKNINITSWKSFKTMLSYGVVDVPSDAILYIKINSRAKIDFIPGLVVNGNMVLRSHSKNINGKLTVNGNMEIISGKEGYIYGDFIINGNLDLRSAGIKQLPDNLKVKHNVYMGSTGIEKLPNKLNVGGDLDVSWTYLSEIPGDLIVDGTLNISQTKINEIPDTAKIGKVYPPNWQY